MLLVLYAYHETVWSRSNLLYFLEHLVPPDVGDHVFVMNGPHTMSISGPNVQVIERPNTCFDFGAWAVGLAAAGDYDYYILMNGSVRGPFLPAYELRPWWSIFLSGLGGSANVGLVGTSLNCWTRLSETHLQSFFLVTHREGIKLVKLQCMASKSDAIRAEIDTSQAFLKANYSLRTMLLAFQRLPEPGVITPMLTQRLYDICLELLAQNGHSGDLYYPDEYGGTSITPLETIFVKHSERGVSSSSILAYSSWLSPGFDR